jgi:hypothetical protein
MGDLIYVLLIVVFYGLMMVYVSWCRRLGKGVGPEERP